MGTYASVRIAVSTFASYKNIQLLNWAYSVYKSGSVDGLSVKTVARDVNSFHSFVAFEIIQDNCG
jgi:hypothetical protein